MANKELFTGSKMDVFNRESEVQVERSENPRGIIRLAAILSTRRGLAYLGWKEQDHNNIPSGPTITSEKRDLIDEAKTSEENARISGVKPREVDCLQVVPYDYVTLRGIIDYTGDTEDLVSFLVKDESGDLQQLMLSEKAVLKSFSEARKFWQDTGQGSGFSIGDREAAKRIFTLVIPSSEPNSPASAILIPPATGGSNEFDFKITMIKVIGKILQSDREQRDEAEEKGYHEALAKFAQRRTFGELEDVLGILETMGFIHSRDEFLDYLDRRQSRGESLGTKIAGLFIKKPALEKMRKSANTSISLEKLEIDQLCDLAEEMHNIALNWSSIRRQNRKSR